MRETILEEGGSPEAVTAPNRQWELVLSVSKRCTAVARYSRIVMERRVGRRVGRRLARDHHLLLLGLGLSDRQ